ncbi:hypothetical protein ES703_72479 [subsurface metagenome]
MAPAIGAEVNLATGGTSQQVSRSRITGNGYRSNINIAQAIGKAYIEVGSYCGVSSVDITISTASINSHKQGIMGDGCIIVRGEGNIG